MSVDVNNFHMLSQTGVGITGSGYWGTTANPGTYTTSWIQPSYITKEEVELILEKAFRKQRLITERALFKEAGLDPKALKGMLESPDSETVKYAETIIDEFI